jgi:hypothetical protein
MVVAETIAGIGAFKTAFDMAKALKDIDDRTRRNEAVIELQEKILGAQSAQATLIQAVDELEKEVTTLKAWDTDKQRYKLTALASGVLAYTPKEGMDNGEPPHNLCTSCYQHGVKSILVSATWNPGRCHVLVCNDCGWYGYLQGMAMSEHKDQRPKPYRGA